MAGGTARARHRRLTRPRCQPSPLSTTRIPRLGWARLGLSHTHRTGRPQPNSARDENPASLTDCVCIHTFIRTRIHAARTRVHTHTHTQTRARTPPHYTHTHAAHTHTHTRHTHTPTPHTTPHTHTLHTHYTHIYTPHYTHTHRHTDTHTHTHSRHTHTLTPHTHTHTHSELSVKHS